MSSTNYIITVKGEQAGKPINNIDPALGNPTDCSSVDNYKDNDKYNVQLKDQNNDRDKDNVKLKDKNNDKDKYKDKDNSKDKDKDRDKKNDRDKKG